MNLQLQPKYDDEFTMKHHEISNVFFRPDFFTLIHEFTWIYVKLRNIKDFGLSVSMRYRIHKEDESNLVPLYFGLFFNSTCFINCFISYSSLFYSPKYYSPSTYEKMISKNESINKLCSTATPPGTFWHHCIWWLMIR